MTCKSFVTVSLAMLALVATLPAVAQSPSSCENFYLAGRYAKAWDTCMADARQMDSAVAYAVMGAIAFEGRLEGKGMDLAEKNFIEAAERGHAASQYNLWTLWNGTDKPADKREAGMGWLRQAVDQDYAPALNIMGVLVEAGQDGEVDLERSRDLYLKASELGYPPAQYNLGELLARANTGLQDLPTAFAWIDRAAQAGVAEAQFTVGRTYQFGELGVDRNEGEAARWFRVAADKGQVDSQLALGLLYLRPTTLKADPAKGIDYLKQAVAQDSAEAKYYLAMEILVGGHDFVERDTAQTLKMLRESAVAGYAPAQSYYGLLLSQTNEHDDDALVWFRKSSGQGFAPAQYHLGRFLAEGRGMDAPDPVESFAWLSLAAEGTDAVMVERAAKYLDDVKGKLDEAALATAKSRIDEIRKELPGGGE